MILIRKHGPGVIWYWALLMYREDLADPLRIQQIIDQDLERSGVTWLDLCTNRVVVDFRAEGHNDSDIELLIKLLRERGVNDFCVAFNAVVDCSKLNYRAECFITHHADSYYFFTRQRDVPQDTKTDCAFLCLIRSVDETRAVFASRLLQLNVDLRLSLGAATSLERLTDFERHFPRHTLPITVDGVLPMTHGHEDHDISNPLFRGCVINIVVESSCQHESNRWHSIFITEKTFKAFAMWQMPIWWAVPGLVDSVRKLGFDLFDDVIDHSYDLEHDQDIRMQMLLDEIKRLSVMNLAHIRNTMRDRLAANWNRLAQIIEEQPEKNYQAWQRLIGETKSQDI